jgi:hypothetical protein
LRLSRVHRFRYQLAQKTVKKFLPLLLIAAAFAQTVQPLTEKTAISFLWEHTDLHDGRIYTNGVFWRSFTALQTVMVTTNSPDGTNTYRFTTTAPLRGEYQFTVTVLDQGLESDPSNVVTQKFKVGWPANLRLIEK